MDAPTRDEVPRDPAASGRGDGAALERLVPRTYGELRRIAHRHMRRERAGHTLNTTALVHEAWVEMAGRAGLAPADRLHFLALASRVMRSVLVDHARQRGAVKRGGGLVRTSLDEGEIAVRERVEEVLALDEALHRLAGHDERLARVVEYRFFGGMTLDETAELLGVSPMTVSRDWAKARAWLHRFLSEAGR